MDKKLLQNAGLKSTLPRMKILQILERAERHHLSAEDIYQALVASKDDVGLATVYRVLTQFEEAGLVKRHNFEGDRAVYELDQGDHHDHLVCVKCSFVQEFVDEVIERSSGDIEGLNDADPSFEEEVHSPSHGNDIDVSNEWSDEG